MYKQFTKVTNEVTKNVVGVNRNRKTAGIPIEIEKSCAERRAARQRMLKYPGDREIRDLYKEHNKIVKRAIKNYK